ncbi:MAG: radical SAM protein [Dehalobacter sp. 4CP]|nr:radical SAM protein [Dehalobacter sp. 4CP]
MAMWECSVCKKVSEGRCRPKQCPECGADKEKIVKKD